MLLTQPDLLICSSDLETGYGPVLLNRVKAELPTCQLLIVLERETKALVREALDSFADGVIFKSSLGTGRGDLIGALRTIAEGCLLPGRHSPPRCRSGAEPEPAAPDRRAHRAGAGCWAGVARGLTNQGIATSLGISLETVKTHVINAKDKLGARDRTQMAVMACSMA